MPENPYKLLIYGNPASSGGIPMPVPYPLFHFIPGVAVAYATSGKHVSFAVPGTSLQKWRTVSLRCRAAGSQDGTGATVLRLASVVPGSYVSGGIDLTVANGADWAEAVSPVIEVVGGVNLYLWVVSSNGHSDMQVELILRQA